MKISNKLEVGFENHHKMGRVVKLVLTEEHEFDKETGDFKLKQPVSTKVVKHFGFDSDGSERVVKEYVVSLSLETVEKLATVLKSVNQDPEVFFGEIALSVENAEV
jgi:hypothetical protein